MGLPLSTPALGVTLFHSADRSRSMSHAPDPLGLDSSDRTGAGGKRLSFSVGDSSALPAPLDLVESLRVVSRLLDSRSMLRLAQTSRALRSWVHTHMAWEEGNDGDEGSDGFGFGFGNEEEEFARDALPVSLDLIQLPIPDRSLLRLAPLHVRVEISEAPPLTSRLRSRFLGGPSPFPGMRLLDELPSFPLRLHTLEVSFDGELADPSRALAALLTHAPFRASLRDVRLQTTCMAYRAALPRSVYALLRTLPNLRHVQMPVWDFLHSCSADVGALPLRSLTLSSAATVRQAYDVELAHFLPRFIAGEGTVLAQHLRQLTLWRMGIMLDAPLLLQRLSLFPLLRSLLLRECSDVRTLLDHPPQLGKLERLGVQLEVVDTMHLLEAIDSARAEKLSEACPRLRAVQLQFPIPAASQSAKLQAAWTAAQTALRTASQGRIRLQTGIHE